MRIIEDWEINISVLWLFKVVTDLVSSMVALMEPGLIDMIREGEIFGMVLVPEMLFFYKGHVAGSFSDSFPNSDFEG